MARVYFNEAGQVVAEGHGVDSRVKDERVELLEKITHNFENDQVSCVETSYKPDGKNPLKKYIFGTNFSIYSIYPGKQEIDTNRIADRYLLDIFKKAGYIFLSEEYASIFKFEFGPFKLERKERKDNRIYPQFPLYSGKCIDVYIQTLKEVEQLSKTLKDLKEFTDPERELFKEVIRKYNDQVLSEMEEYGVHDLVRDIIFSGLDPIAKYSSRIFVTLLSSAHTINRTITETYTKLILGLANTQNNRAQQKLYDFYFDKVKHAPLLVEKAINLDTEPEEVYTALKLEESSKLRKAIEEERAKTKKDKMELLKSISEHISNLIQNYRETEREWKNLGNITINGKNVKGTEVKLEDLKKIN